jgi:hypothetical protein
MMFVLSVIALLFVAFITQPTPCESLKCYECSGNKSCGRKQNDRIIDCAGKCLSYLNEDANGKGKNSFIHSAAIDFRHNNPTLLFGQLQD